MPLHQVPQPATQPTELATTPPQAEGLDLGDVVHHLVDTLKRVTADDVTPAAVNAACNVASQIEKLGRLQLDYLKLRRSAK